MRKRKLILEHWVKHLIWAGKFLVTSSCMWKKNVLGCFPSAQYHQANLGHQLESQWFNSNLTLLTKESIRFRRLKAQIPSPSSPLETSCKAQFITCASDPQVIDERFQWAPPFSSVQSLSRVQLFATPWIAAHQASLSITNSRSSLRLTAIESVMPSSHLILCRPLLLLPPIPPSIRVFSNESTLHMRWPKFWSFSFSISPSSEQPGLISFRMDWLDLLAVQETLESLLQHHSSKA